MYVLKLFAGRGQKFACLILLCWLAVPAAASEMKRSSLKFTKPISAPLAQPNSTFHADLTVLRLASRGGREQHPAVFKPSLKAHDSQWLKDRLTVRQGPQATDLPAPPNPAPAGLPPAQPPDSNGVQWKSLIAQSVTFLWIEHGFRFLTEPGTREELRGPFFKDWYNSVRKTRGWRDGDPFLVNYIGHPMQGSVTNYMFVHNDPKYLRQEMGFNKAYFKSRLRAMLFSTVYSTQFELGPLSEASLGNVGLHPTQTSRHPSALVDLVVTPTLGTVWMMAEDALDRFVIKRLESHVENRVVRLLVRGFLNPSRSFANVLRGRYPWNRDGRRL